MGLMAGNGFMEFAGIKLIPRQLLEMDITGPGHNGMYARSAVSCDGLRISSFLPYCSWRRWCRFSQGSN